MNPDIKAATLKRGILLRSFHRTRDALLLSAFAGDEEGVAGHREELNQLAASLRDDLHTQALHRQAVDIADAPNPREHALRILESLYPGQARSVTE